MLGILKDQKRISEFVARGHSIDLYDFKWALSRYIKVLPFYNFKLKAASKIFAVSKHGMQAVASGFPFYREKIQYSYLGVRDQGINPFAKDALFTIVTCSNLSDNKRVHKVPEIIKHLTVPVKWIHFGSGDLTSETKIRDQVVTLPENCAVEMRGFTPNSEIKDHYRTHCINLFLNLSEAEGLPVSLMEAISFGIPVMATAVYGNPEIANEHTGFSIPFDFDEKLVASTIQNFANDPKRQMLVRQQARKYYSEKFNADKNYSDFAGELLKYKN